MVPRHPRYLLNKRQSMTPRKCPEVCTTWTHWRADIKSTSSLLACSRPPRTRERAPVVGPLRDITTHFREWHDSWEFASKRCVPVSQSSSTGNSINFQYFTFYTVLPTYFVQSLRRRFAELLNFADRSSFIRFTNVTILYAFVLIRITSTWCMCSKYRR